MLFIMLTKIPVTLLFLVCVFSLLSVSSHAQTVVKQKLADTVGVGAAAPDFTLADQHGRNLTLSSERSKRPVVLVFYRGHW